jgi:hypothetical protein
MATTPRATSRPLPSNLLFLFIAAGAAFVPAGNATAQCCSAGSGSCIVGGSAQGVLRAHEMQLATNFQFIDTRAFFRESERVDEHTFDGFRSRYQYFKLAYGASDKLTLSLETGYHLLKEEIGRMGDPANTFSSSGFGDLVIFPRYEVLRKEGRKGTNEIALGLGYKVPLGSYNDSIGRVEPFSGHTYYLTKPTAVQLSSGAQDLIFYAFLHHGFIRSKINLSATAMYVKTGWNPNGEKLGNFTSLALFVARPINELIGITLQGRYESITRMQVNEAVMLFGKPSNYFPEATGYRKFFLTPQISLTKGAFTFYASTDLPLHQYMNTSEFYTQVGSQHTTTVGLSYRFLVKRPAPEVKKVAGRYYCPMHPEENADGPGRCGKCGMDLVKEK